MDLLTISILAFIAFIAFDILVLLFLASRKPNVFRVKRSTIIQAPADEIYPFINNLHKWAEWSPYDKLDPAMKKSYSGPPEGNGAVYEWEGNGKVGKGRMEITDTRRPSAVFMKLDFEKPFKNNCIVEFKLDSQGSKTEVTWDMHGPNKFIGKLVSVFLNMDKLVGKDFETGLANLKALAEK